MSAAAATTTRIHNTTAAGQIVKANELIAEIALIDHDYATEVWAELKARWAEDACSYKFVSGHISRMIEAKKSRCEIIATTQDRPSVPSGRYAITGADGTTKFYRVLNDKGHYVVKVYASDALHLVPSYKAMVSILRQIEKDGIEVAQARYARESTRCFSCGRKLTDPVSIEAGQGLDCRSK